MSGQPTLNNEEFSEFYYEGYSSLKSLCYWLIDFADPKNANTSAQIAEYRALVAGDFIKILRNMERQLLDKEVFLKGAHAASVWSFLSQSNETLRIMTHLSSDDAQFLKNILSYPFEDCDGRVKMYVNIKRGEFSDLFDKSACFPAGEPLSGTFDS